MKVAKNDLISKFKSPEEFFLLAKKFKSKGKRLIQCDGVFDIVHPGHVEHFAQAKKYGDILYVVVAPDIEVKERKGPQRPIFDESTRATCVASIWCVDYVVTNKNLTTKFIIETIQPDVWVKGPDYKNDSNHSFLKVKSFIKSYGGKIIFTDSLETHSTDLFKKIISL